MTLPTVVSVENTTSATQIQAQTEVQTEAPQLVTEAPTQLVTEAPTQLLTEAPTQPVTEAPTQPVYWGYYYDLKGGIVDSWKTEFGKHLPNEPFYVSNSSFLYCIVYSNDILNDDDPLANSITKSSPQLDAFIAYAIAHGNSRKVHISVIYYGYHDGRLVSILYI